MSLWERSGRNTMSKNLYFLCIGAFTALGIFVSFLTSSFFLHAEMGWGTAILVLILGIAGVILAKTSDRPILSLAGYMLVAIPYGALLGPLVNDVAGVEAAKYFGYPITADITIAFFVTTIYVLIFGLIGALIPDSLESWQGPIIGLLIVGIVGYFVIPIAGFFGVSVSQALGVWDWLIILLFAAIIMYDFNRAVRIPYTLDNAIDVALEVYLDWFNVFIRLLARRKSD